MSLRRGGGQRHGPGGPALGSGEVAGWSGLTPDTLRYGERLELLPVPARTAGGFRMYRATTPDRLRFIRQARRPGPGLDPIAELVRHLDRGGCDHCRRMWDRLAAKLREVDARVAERRVFRRAAEGDVERCSETLRRQVSGACPVVSALHWRRSTAYPRSGER